MSPWTTITFDGSPTGSLPLNWTQYNSDSTANFAVTASPPAPLSGTHTFSVTDPQASGDTSRAWLDETMPADVQVSAAVYVNTVIPAQVIARGSNLDLPDSSGSGPSFYAVQLASAGPGPKLELVKDVNGTLTSLASINDPNYVSGAWLRETLDVEGSTVRAQLFDPNTGEYLNSSGQWQSSQAWALTVLDNSVSGPGVVGLGRKAGYTGTVTFDDFSVQAVATDQSFDATPAGTGSLPDNWSSWSTNSSDVVAVATPTSPITPPSVPNALAITAVGSGDSARAWLLNSLPADLSASAYTFLATTPAQVLARGSNLDSSTPSYYAVEVKLGMTVKLVKVVNGVETDLASLNSTSYLDNTWVQETLALSGTTLEAQVYRPDTQQYLNSSGGWQSTPTWALTATDSSITAGGQAGVGRPVIPEYVNTNYFDDFTTATGMDAQDFDASTSLPSNWQQSSSNQFSVVAGPSSNFLSAYNVLESTGGSTAAQVWDKNEYLTNAQVSVGMYLPSPEVQVIARGTFLDTSAPNYYGLSVTPGEYGLTVDLVRVNNGGNPTTLAQISPLPTYLDNYFNDQWIQATLYVDGTSVRAQVYRADTGQYLNSEDLWQSTPTYALDVTDTDSQALIGPGYGGLARPSSVTGTHYFDNFAVTPLSAANTPPSVSISAPSGTLTGVVTVTATPSSNIGISKVDFYVEDGTTVLTHWEETAGPYSWAFDTSFVPNGTHTLVVLAYDAAGNVGVASTSVTTSNNTTLTMPSISPHQDNIGIVELDYGSHYDSTLLQDNVDAVVVDDSNLGDVSTIHSIAPNIQELIYTNVSNLYYGLLTSWLNYAEQHAIDAEQAFYHVSVATPWLGSAGSTKPVDWFWGVYGYQNGTWSDFIAAAHAYPGTNGVSFGNGTSVVGDTLNVGYTDKFREIDINLSQARSGGSYVLEYPTVVDSAGNPTAWATLTTLSDTTNGLTTTGAGKIIFDPPSNWVPSVVDRDQSGSSAPPSGGFPAPQYYYVRFRTTAAFSTIPVASTILGYNYTGAVSDNMGQTTGNYTIPAFDYAADTNHDGYLNAQEYANRAPGMDAYFAYQSRLFTYGQMRFVTNPSSPAFRDWAINQYYPEYLKNNQYATGLWVDNSGDAPPGVVNNNFSIIEPTDSYNSDYASLLNAIGHAIAPYNGWIMANVAGVNSILGSSDGQTTADPVIQKVQAYYEEKGIRALTNDTTQFLGFYNLIHYQDNLPSPGYAVLDSVSLNGTTTSDEKDQTQLSTLAAYYLLAPTNPSQGALNFFAGGKWVQSWSPPPSVFNHWSPAAAYNVGTPVSALPQTPVALVTNGSDPENSNYKFNVYERSFTGPNGQNILVLYKPVSEYNNQPGTTDDPQTATTVTPTGGYSWYVLQADGTLSSTDVTSISLQNGEGAILVQAGTLAPAIVGVTMRVAAPIPTSPAAATASTPSPSGASSISQGSVGPNPADLFATEMFERLLPGWFASSAAGTGQIPISPLVAPSDVTAVLDRIFSLWTVAKSDLDRVFYLWTTAKRGTAFAWSNEPAT